MDYSAMATATPPRVRDFLAGNHKLLLDCKWVASASGETFAAESPADGRFLCEAYSVGADDGGRSRDGEATPVERAPSSNLWRWCLIGSMTKKSAMTGMEFFKRGSGQ